MKTISAVVKKPFNKFQSQEVVSVGTPVTLIPDTGTPGDPRGYVQYTLQNGYSSRMWGVPNAIIAEFFTIPTATVNKPGFKNADGFNNADGFDQNAGGPNFQNADGTKSGNNSAPVDKSTTNKDMSALLKAIPTSTYLAGGTGAIVGAAIAHTQKAGWLGYLLWAAGLGLGAAIVTNKMVSTSPSPKFPEPKKDIKLPAHIATQIDATKIVTKDEHSNFAGSMGHKKKRGTGELGHVPIAPSNAQVGSACGSGLGTWTNDGSGYMYCASNKHFPLAVS